MIIECKNIHGETVLLDMAAIQAVSEVLDGITVNIHGDKLFLSEPGIEEMTALWFMYQESSIESEGSQHPTLNLENAVYTEEEIEILTNPAYKTHHRYIYKGKAKKRSK